MSINIDTTSPLASLTPTAVIEVNKISWESSSVSPKKAYIPMPVFFEGWKSTNREEIIEYKWNFGEDSTSFEYGFNACHVYETTGVYTTTLTVKNIYGNTDTATIDITALDNTGTTYYVDATGGNDSNDGLTPSTAWQTANKAMAGISTSFYHAGDLILFKPIEGAEYICTTQVLTTHWQYGIGYTFRSSVPGTKAKIRWQGTSNTTWLFMQGVGARYITFKDLEFDMRSDTNHRAIIMDALGDFQSIAFIDCDFKYFYQGLIMRGNSSGFFVINCTTYDSIVTHLYCICNRVAMIDNNFDYSANHICYLEEVYKGLFLRNRWTRPAFGRTTLRIDDGDYIWIENNHFEGWIDPRTGSSQYSAGGDRWNYLLITFAPNGTTPRLLEYLVVKNNVMKNAEGIVNIASARHVYMEHNEIYNDLSIDMKEKNLISIGSWGGFDTIACEDIHISNNLVYAGSSSDSARGSLFYIRGESALLSGYKTLDHSGIFINNNHIRRGNLVRMLRLDQCDAAQRSQLNFVNNTVNTNDDLSDIYYDSTNNRSFSYWQTNYEGLTKGTYIESNGNVPFGGWLIPNLLRFNQYPLQIDYTGAWDDTTTGNIQVKLWKKGGPGQWVDTGLINTGTSGSFYLYDDYLYKDKKYNFALQAIDSSGLSSSSSNFSTYEPFTMYYTPDSSAVDVLDVHKNVPTPTAVIEIPDGSWVATRRPGSYTKCAPTYSFVPFPILFEGWKSTVFEDIVEFKWNFGEDSTSFEYGFNACHVYETPGVYTCTLTVTNKYNKTDTTTVDITALDNTGKIYYVDATGGNDSNDGLTPETAWLTGTKAFTGITNSFYNPGDQILFKPIEGYDYPANCLTVPHWQYDYGYVFKSSVPGTKAVIRYNTGNTVPLFHWQGTGAVGIKFVDLEFNMMNASNSRAVLLQTIQGFYSILFLRCYIHHMAQGLLFQSISDPAGGHAFVVDCDFYDSSTIQVYAEGIHRLTVKNCDFDYSMNHIGYLHSSKSAGLIKNNKCRRWAFGRHAIRLCTADNVLITENDLEGWIDPIDGTDAHGGGGYRWNFLVMHLAPNTPYETKLLNNVHVCKNRIKNGENLLNIGSAIGMHVYDNTFDNTNVTMDQKTYIVLGSIHNYDLRSSHDINIYKNIFYGSSSASYSIAGSIFKVKGTDSFGTGSPIGGKYHTGINFYDNYIYCSPTTTNLRFLEFSSAADTTQRSYVSYIDNFIQTKDSTSLHYYNGTGSSYYSSWVTNFEGDARGNYYSTVASTPFPGWVSFKSVRNLFYPIQVDYSGAYDDTTSIQSIRLYVRINDGSWQLTDQSSNLYSGSFYYTDTDNTSNTIRKYNFMLDAVDDSTNTFIFSESRTTYPTAWYTPHKTMWVR